MRKIRHKMFVCSMFNNDMLVILFQNSSLKKIGMQSIKVCIPISLLFTNTNSYFHTVSLIPISDSLNTGFFPAFFCSS